MPVRGLGITLFALGLAGLGVVSLVSGDFVYLWQPAPSWMPAGRWLAQASGALLLACSLPLLWRRTVVRSSLVLAFYGIASMVLVHAPRLAAKPHEIGEWFGLGEVATFVAGALLLFADASPVSPASRRSVHVARLLFALSLPVFGIAHFVYARPTADMVPSWLPAHLALAWFTGGAHIAAGIAILLGVLRRLAAMLEAIMVTLFLLTVNAPDLARKMGSWQWTELFIAAAIAGVAFLVAHSYRGDRWLSSHFPGEGRRAR